MKYIEEEWVKSRETKNGQQSKQVDSSYALGLGPIGRVELEEPPDERAEAGPVHGGEGVVRALDHGLAEVLDAVGFVVEKTEVGQVGICINQIHSDRIPCSASTTDRQTDALVGQEGRVQGGQVVEDAAQGPDVGGGGVGLLEVDLGADEVRGAHLGL